jgi:outer membrane protease
MNQEPASAGLQRASAMGGHVFSEIFLHVTWHTDGNAPVLRGDIEKDATASYRIVAAKQKAFSSTASVASKTTFTWRFRLNPWFRSVS